MAALALPFIMGAQAGSFAYFAYAAVGAYIDSAVIFPRLFGPDPTEGPKIDDLEIARWGEGTPVPRVFGQQAQVASQVIFQSPIKEIKDEQSGGGKGGSGGSYITYKYYSTLAVALCEGPISRVKKIKADGKTIWNVAPDINYTSTDIDGAVGTSYSNNLYRHYITLTSTDNNADLSLLKSGKNITLTAPGISNAQMSVDWSDVNLVAGTTTARVWVGGWTSSSSHPYSGWASGTTTIFQDLPTHSGKHFSEVIFYNGDQEQVPNSLIEAFNGNGEVPAHRGTCYVVFKDFYLTDWGNRVPSITAEIEEDEDRTFKEAIDKILSEAKIDPGEYDLSELPDVPLRGYKIAGPQETAKSLQPLLIHQDILVQQIGGKLRFFPRANARIIDIDAKYLAAGDGPSPIEITERPTSQIPDEVNVDFLDIDNEYNRGSVRQRRNNDTTTELLQLSLPVAMTAQEARGIATRMLWHEWNGRFQVRLQLPAIEFMGKIHEGDVLRFTAMDEEWTVLVTKMDRGENLLFAIEGVTENLDSQAGVEVGEQVVAFMNGGREPGGFLTGRVTDFPPAATFVPFECAPLREAHSRQPGFYFAACSADKRLNFNGAALFESLDGGETFDKVQEVTGAAYMGAVKSWTDVDAIHGQFDLVNEIEVDFVNGAPQSVTELELLNGSNRALFDGEIIGFQNAELVSGTRWKLTKLLRGLRGTDALVNGHTAPGADLDFVLLNQPFVHFHELTAAAIGRTRHYKLVANGLHPEEVEARPITIAGSTVKPLAPVHFSKTLDGSNNATVTWVNRTRSTAGLFGSHPNGEPAVAYRTSILSSGTAVRTKSSAVTSTTYTAAEATADGLTPGDPLDVTIAQTSEYHGFGVVSPTTTI